MKAIGKSPEWVIQNLQELQDLYFDMYSTKNQIMATRLS
jgi:predicted RNase H-like HicB family nuclease